MPTYDLGSTIVFGLKVKDSAGALADLGGGDPTATLTKPDGTTASGSVTKTATGTYAATYTSDVAGRWLCTWDGTGTNSGGLPYQDVADVWAADARLIISLADARAALNMPSTATSDDDEIRLYVSAATAIIEDLIGRVLSTEVVETHSGNGRAAILLDEIPASITSVTEDGTTLTAGTGYALDNAGILWRGASKNAGTWSATSPRNVVVTYAAGATVVPSNVILAARELVRHQYAQGQQPWRQGYGGSLGDEPSTYMAAGFAVPNAVVDKLKPQAANKVPGFA